jgi:hypothetical protein
MCTKRLHYLLPKLKLKTLLLTFVASLFLSACGIKGDLYQTPEQPVIEKEAVESDVKQVPEEVIREELKSEKQPVAEQQTEKVNEQPAEQPTTPALEPSLDSAIDLVKSPNNVS